LVNIIEEGVDKKPFSLSGMKWISGEEVHYINWTDLDTLRLKIDALKQDLQSQSSSNADTKAVLIKRLHTYNDIKDFCQFLMGRLAQMQQTTVASLYDKFGLDTDD